MRRFLCLVLFFPMIASPLMGGDQIWSALVLGVNERPPPPPDRHLVPLLSNLLPVFGYNTYYLLGKKKQRITEGDETWLVPSKEFYFRVVCLAREKNAYRIKAELYRKKELLLETEARLARDEPLLIGGPGWGDGKLILILRIP